MASPNRIDIIRLGASTSFYHKAWNDKDLNTDWADLGGNFIYEPVTLTWGPDLVYVFGVKFDATICYKSLDKPSGKWTSEWIDLKAIRDPSDPNAPKPLKWAAKPAVLSLYPRSMEVVGLASDNLLYHSTWKAGRGWSIFTVIPFLGKHFREAPSLVSYDWGRFDVFAMGLDGYLYHKWWVLKKGWLPQPSGVKSASTSTVSSDLSWEDLPDRSGETAGIPQDQMVSAWESLGGPFLHTPSAVSMAEDRIDLVGIGPGGKVYHRVWKEDTAAWSKKWAEVPMTSNPVGKLEVVSWGLNRMDIFVIGSDRALHHKWFDATGDGVWGPNGEDEALQGGAMGDQLTATSMGSGNLVVLHIGGNSHVYVKSWTQECGWGPEESPHYRSLGADALIRVAACAAQDAMFNP